MRWLISLAFVGLATLVLAQEADVAPDANLAAVSSVRRPSRNLAAVIDTISARRHIRTDRNLAGISLRRMRPDRNIAAISAPVVPEASILPYVGPSQPYWPGFAGPNNWYGWGNQAPAPYWGGFAPPRRSWPRSYWRQRFVKPAKIPVETVAVEEPKPEVETAIKVAVEPEVVPAVVPEVAIAVVPEVDAAVSSEVAPEVVAAVLPEIQAAVLPQVEAAVLPEVQTADVVA